jgi:hypothetical protein
VLEYRTNGSDIILGVCETTPRAILDTQRDFHEDDVEADQTTNGFQLQKSLDTVEVVGRLRVHLAQVIDNAEGGDNVTRSFYGDTSDIFAECDVIPTPHRKESLRDLDDPYVVDLANMPKPMVSPAYFQDYVEDGCQLDFCVAIDFTSSNGT